MNYMGVFDVCNSDLLLGWAINKNNPNDVIYIDIYDFETHIATIPANIFREDLLQHGIGNGYHSFQYQIPNNLRDGKEHLISVKFSGTNVHLINSPKKMDHDPITKKRIEIASNYLFGSGIEIGALHRPLPISEISNICEIKYVDRMDVVELRKHYPELESCNLVQVDIIDDGETLSTIESDSLDFIICNHMLEHCENPIRTIANFITKLKRDGTIFLTVPDKRFCFDKDRELTSFKHCMDDDQKGPETSRYNHYIEWSKHVNGIKDEGEAINQANRLLKMNYSIHFHVWDESTFNEFIVETKKYLGSVFTIEKIELSFGEIICVLKKV